MTKNKTTTTTNQTLALIVAGALLASFMGTMGITMTQSATTTQTAEASSHSVRGLYYWQTTRCSTAASCDNLRLETIAAEGGTLSNLMFHYAAGAANPQAIHIDEMKQIISSGDFLCNQVGMQGKTLADLETLAPIVKQEFDTELNCSQDPWLGYNIEGDCVEGTEEQCDFLDSVEEAKSIASTNGLRLFVTVGHDQVHDADLVPVAGQANIINLQVQDHQDDQADCSGLVSHLDAAIDAIRAQYSTKVITFQLSHTRNYQGLGYTPTSVLTNCMEAAYAGTTVNGLGTWWGGADIDNHRWRNGMQYWENPSNFPSA